MVIKTVGFDWAIEICFSCSLDLFLVSYLLKSSFLIFCTTQIVTKWWLPTSYHPPKFTILVPDPVLVPSYYSVGMQFGMVRDRYSMACPRIGQYGVVQQTMPSTIFSKSYSIRPPLVIFLTFFYISLLSILLLIQDEYCQ